MSNEAKEHLIEAIKKGLEEVISLMDPLSDSLASVASKLRFEQSRENLTNFSNVIKDLESIYKFVHEIQNAINQLNTMEMSIKTDFINIWIDSSGIINNLMQAFEAGDWVSVSDLIEYEIVPLLSKGKTSFIELLEILNSQ